MRAWERMFNDFLTRRGVPVPYTEADYHRYVDGRPRFDGVREFLASRSLTLPEGSPDDAADVETIGGLGNRKNDLFMEVLHDDGVEAYPGSVRLVAALKEAGVRRAIVSSSRNAPAVLETAGMLDEFEIIVHGGVAAELGLPGKPAPDTFEYAADQLGVAHDKAVVLEDALSGVAAGAAGSFGLVVGVDRGAGADALRDHGADVVVSDLEELLP